MQRPRLLAAPRAMPRRLAMHAAWPCQAEAPALLADRWQLTAVAHGGIRALLRLRTYNQQRSTRQYARTLLAAHLHTQPLYTS
jgi:hypothetical protein